ncbi:O-antigen ligase domain-containing protein [Pyxidicoccus fallax]|uniref:O-antigen ligase domain-containing protein n=1 Tax=Pyxidicoccus fallax TaxID=394095 RepID=A0A848LBA5_9BACT|nr:exopolysaccharide repeat unit polymerase [Pyxidicoccus fallax]NMO13973.1 O-antigen ligase domain-containing protein [Pyxidicoccus fallax]NPC76695.1 O-antigen ligase domain-containing protein [Pyxidicoccus fallax]
MYAPYRPSYLRFAALLGFLAVAAVGGSVIHPVVGLAPILGIGVVWVVHSVPIRYPVLVLTYLVLAVDYGPDRPQSGFWPSPLAPIGDLLFTQLNALTKIPVLRFPLIDGLIFWFLGLAVYRRVTKSPLEPNLPPMPRPLAIMTALTLISILAMEFRGLARGGDFKNSLWQWHQGAVLPFIVAMYHYALRGPEDWPILSKIVIAAGITKALVGSYFALVVVPAMGIEVEYTTSHSDSMTFIFCVLVVLTRFIEKPKLAHVLRGLGVLAFIVPGMIFNDRRLAYVSLGGCLMAAYLINPWTPLKRFITRVLPFFVPIIVVYLAIGWNRSGGVWGPAETIRSLIDGQGGEGNLDYRDLENLNMIATWDQFPILGTGYGHEFLEPYPLPDISFVFPTYRFHPHNSLLGLLAFGGLIGYTGVWMYIAGTVYFAVRAYHRSTVSEYRSAALVIVGVLASYVNQVFGDMGIISYICTFLVAMCVAMAGKLATTTGAWPIPNSALIPPPARAPEPPPGAIVYSNPGEPPTPAVAVGGGGTTPGSQEAPPPAALRDGSATG